jgi:hypothetical protein
MKNFKSSKLTRIHSQNASITPKYKPKSPKPNLFTPQMMYLKYEKNFYVIIITKEK